MVTTDSLFTLKRVPQVVLNAMAYTLCLMQDVLEGFTGKLCFVCR